MGDPNAVTVPGRTSVRRMPIQTGTHRLGPANATLRVRTYRAGVASKAGHDLVIDVTRWEASLAVATDWAQSSVELNADPHSLEVHEGLHGVKPLSDKDLSDIHKNIDERVLGGRPIAFRSTSVQPLDGESRLIVGGDLELAGTTHPVSFELSFGPDGQLSGSAELQQSNWGIRPYAAMMGALRVRDGVELVLDASVPASQAPAPPSTRP